jgi:hypothetical protein
MNQEAEVTVMAMDVQKPMAQRLEAINGLANSGQEAAVRTLLQVAEREGERIEILRASGRGLATLMSRGARLVEFDLRDVQDAAYEAFCDWNPEHDPDPRS